MNRSKYTLLFMTFIVLSWAVPPAADAGDVIPPTDHTVWLADNSETGAVENETTAAPEIAIPDPLFTFEAVVDGTEVVHDFRVYNRGKGELAITKVQTG